MIQPSPAPQDAGSRRHMLVCDVHLLLINSMGDVLFGWCQSTGYKMVSGGCRPVTSKRASR